jgi:hypothetical protein
MTVDIAFIEHLRKRYGMNIPENLEAFLLEEYDEEPFPYEYSDQDLYEQIRKLVMNYHKGLVDVTLKGSELRLKQRFQSLKDEYIAAMYKIRTLEDEVKELKDMLLEHGVVISDSETF